MLLNLLVNILQAYRMVFHAGSEPADPSFLV